MATLADEVSPELLRYELEQAWALMRHHERNAEAADRNATSVREYNSLLIPKVNAFNAIARFVASWEKHHNAEQAMQQVERAVKVAQKEVIERGQAIAKAKSND